MTNKEPQVLVDARRVVALEPIIKAFMAGKDIQVKLDGREEWQDVTWLSPNWASNRCEWRIKPGTHYLVKFTRKRDCWLYSGESNYLYTDSRDRAEKNLEDVTKLLSVESARIVKLVEVPE